LIWFWVLRLNFCLIMLEWTFLARTCHSNDWDLAILHWSSSKRRISSFENNALYRRNGYESPSRTD
jgi:hypothetical protein